jgi:hypothetical protein
VLESRQRAFLLPHDARAGDVMPDGEHAVFVRGGSLESDLVVVQAALPRR